MTLMCAGCSTYSGATEKPKPVKVDIPPKPAECEPLRITPTIKVGADARVILGKYIVALDERDARSSICNAWADAVVAAYGKEG